MIGERIDLTWAGEGWIHCGDMADKGLLPCDVIDAGGNVVLRPITKFHPRTGIVVSFVYPLEEVDGGGAFKTRKERFSAPLTAVRISEELAAERNRVCTGNGATQ